MMFKYPYSIFMNRNYVFAVGDFRGKHVLPSLILFKVLAGIAKAFGAAADIVATMAMCMFLSKVDTGIRRFA